LKYCIYIKNVFPALALAPALDLIPINVVILADQAEATLANHAVATQDLTLIKGATPAVALEAEDHTAAAVIGDIDTAAATVSLGEAAPQGDTAEAEAPENLADTIQDVAILIAADHTQGDTLDPTLEGHALQRGLAPRSLVPPRNHVPQRRGLAVADIQVAVHAPEGPDLQI
jgi:hypothetical protein